MRAHGVDLEEISTGTGDLKGTLWTLEGAGDLNANLVRLEAGEGVGEHVNEEGDVLFVGVSGSGVVRVGGEKHPIASGKLALATKGVRRSIEAGPEGVAYLTVHRRRGPIKLEDRPGGNETSRGGER